MSSDPARRQIALPNGVVDVVETGSGDDVIILVHGAASSPHALGRLAGRLAADGWRVLVPALDGYGTTRMHGPGDPVARNTAMLLGVRAGITARRVAVIGHSMGGLVALAALRAGMAAAAAMVWEPVAFGALDVTDPAQRDARDWDRAVVASMAAHMAYGDAEAGVAAFIEAWNDQAWADIPPAVRAGLVAIGPRLAADVVAVSRDVTPAASYAAITIPILVLCGSRSPPAAQMICQRLAAVLPAATLVALEGLGHMAPVMQPGAVHACMQQYLAVLGAAQA